MAAVVGVRVFRLHDIDERPEIHDRTVRGVRAFEENIEAGLQ
jgi:hypothetical protein